jgi:hypothetical protein
MSRFVGYVVLLSLLLTQAGCSNADSSALNHDAPASGREPTRWFKGNLHTHSVWSDGNDFPEMIAQWYRDQGYHFLALSDHNILSEGEKWFSIADSKRQNLDVAVKKYRERFPEVFQTRKGAKGEEIRLSTLNDVRKLVEKPGQFIMIQSEEISDRFPETVEGKTRNRPIHLNAANIGEVVKPQGGSSVRDVIRNNLRAVEEQSKRLNRPIVTHLNHPNFQWGVSAEDLAHVVEEKYFEIYNGHPGTNTRGDATHPSLEKLWDICNTIRLAQLNAEPLFGLGTDDAHHYHTPGMNRSTPGRGWIMLRAKDLSIDSVMAGLQRGDFYASSGITLRDVKYDATSRTITIQIEPDSDAVFTTDFVGTPKNYSSGGRTPLDSDDVGTTFASVTGTTATYTLTGDELYVRAIVNSSNPPAVPSYENQRAQAWTQPVGWERSEAVGGEAVKR